MQPCLVLYIPFKAPSSKLRNVQTPNESSRWILFLIFISNSLCVKIHHFGHSLNAFTFPICKFVTRFLLRNLGISVARLRETSTQILISGLMVSLTSISGLFIDLNNGGGGGMGGRGCLGGGGQYSSKFRV